MIVPDINILIYAYDQSSAFHGRSSTWWNSTIRGTTPIGLPWAVILGFTRITTNTKLYGNALTVTDALRVVNGWLSLPMVTIVEPGTQHWALINQLSVQARAGSKLVSDIHIAAMAIEHRATLVTNDKDFQRFPSLKTYNPL